MEQRRKLRGHPQRFLPQHNGRSTQIVVTNDALHEKREVDECAERRRPSGSGIHRLEVDQRRMRTVALPHRCTPVAALMKNVVKLALIVYASELFEQG